MNFFQTIKSSIFNPQFYADNLNVSAKKSFGYFTKLALLAGLCLTIIISIRFVPTLTGLLSPSSVDELVQSYPKELTITFKGGHASTNVTEPYSIPFPAQFNTDKARTQQPKNAVVIDTTSSFNLDSFYSSDTLVLLTKDYLVYRKDRNQAVTVQNLKSFPDFVLNQSSIASFLEGIRPYLLIVVPCIVLGIFVGSFLVLVVSNLLFLLLATLVTFIIAKIRKQNLSYGQLYKLGLYLVTSIILIDIIFAIISISIGIPGYVDLLIYVILFAVNIKPAVPAN